MTSSDHLERVARSPRQIRIRLKAIALQRRVEIIEAECGSRLPIIIFASPESEEECAAFEYFSQTIGSQKPHLRVVPINLASLHDTAKV